MYRVLCWPFRRQQGEKQTCFLSSGLLVWDTVKKKGCLLVRDLLRVTLQRKRPDLQKNQSSPCKLDSQRHCDLSHVSVGKLHEHSSLNLSGGQATSAYLYSYWCTWVALAIMMEFRDPDTANRRVLVCTIEIGLDAYECWNVVSLALSGL